MSFIEILSKMKKKSEDFSCYLTECNNLNNDLKNKSEKLIKLIGDVKTKNKKSRAN